LACARIAVHLDATVVIDHAGLIQVQAVHVGPTPDGQQQDITLQFRTARSHVDVPSYCTVTSYRQATSDCTVAILPHPFDRHPEVQVHALRFKHPRQNARRLSFIARQQSPLTLDECHLCPQAAEGLRHLTTNRPGADDH
jgi:hypothetical protein